MLAWLSWLGGLDRLSCTHLCQRPDHAFFSFGELNDQAILTAEASVIALSQSPNLFHHGSARAGQAYDLAALQVRQFTNTVHIGRFQKGTPKAAKLWPNTPIIDDRKEHSQCDM
jgi:hypothetical protein